MAILRQLSGRPDVDEIGRDAVAARVEDPPVREKRPGKNAALMTSSTKQTSTAARERRLIANLPESMLARTCAVLFARCLSAEEPRPAQ